MWPSARPAAEEVWRQLALNPMLSENFRDLARANLAMVAAARDIDRLLPAT